MGVGRIIVKIGDFQPAPALTDEFLSSIFAAQWLFTSCSENASSMCVGAPSITLSITRLLWQLQPAHRLMINFRVSFTTPGPEVGL